MRTRGSVFVLTLAVLTGLVALVAALATANRSGIRATAARMERQRARIMVESGVQRAMAELKGASASKTTLSDGWAQLGEKGSVAFEVGSDAFRIEVVDASARIDLNRQDETHLKRLPLTEEQIQCVLDWREEAKSPRARGAKDEYYNRLSNGYNAKLKPFDSVDELLLVKSMTPSDLFTLERSQKEPLAPGSEEMPILSEMLAVDPVSSDTNPDGDPKLDVNSATADDLLSVGLPSALVGAILNAKKDGFKSLTDVLRLDGMTKDAAKTIVDYLMVGKSAESTGKLNINTASKASLNVLFGPDSSLPAAIVSHQGTGFRGLGDLLDLPDFTVQRLAGSLNDLCVSSHSFVVRVVGAAGSCQSGAEATITLGSDGTPQITGCRSVEPRAAIPRWGWDATPTQQTVVGTK